jgi:hypothetical protein
MEEELAEHQRQMETTRKIARVLPQRMAAKENAAGPPVEPETSNERRATPAPPSPRRPSGAGLPDFTRGGVGEMPTGKKRRKRKSSEASEAQAAAAWVDKQGRRKRGVPPAMRKKGRS